MQEENPVLFDGTPNSILKIEVSYCQQRQVKPSAASHAALLEEYRERLVLDRASDAIAYTQENDAGLRITHRYELPGMVSGLLDELPLDLFSVVKGSPPDAMDDPGWTRTYTIAVCTRYGRERTIAGTFDREGLPQDWAEFADTVLEWVGFCEARDLFDPRLYGRRKRRKSDYIYCSVSFEDGGRNYSYLARDDSYAAGDLVVVPAGRDNHEAVARIRTIGYYAAGEAPFPVERTKYILRKYEGGEDEAGE